MGEDRGSWVPHQHSDQQIQNCNSPTAPLDLNLGTNMVSTNGNFPVHAAARLPNLKMVQANEPRGWFYCLPQFPQALRPVTVSGSTCENTSKVLPPNVGHGCVKKRLLVFDQSGDQTTLVFGSGIRKPVQFPTWMEQFPGVPGPESDINHPLEPILNKSNDINEVSEMHEDTEELNALLYSDGESDYTEDDEVTSTGHSPGSVTDHGKSEGINKEVASCNKPTRKRKLCDEDHHNDMEYLEDTASSGNPEKFTGYEYEAESICPLSNKMGTKRTKKEKIKEAISVLQRIIPNGKGKDAVVVIDEAIQYLTSLKLKAKALGLGAL